MTTGTGTNHPTTQSPGRWDPGRRTVLQRGAALLAGGVALAGTRWASAASPAAAAPPNTLTVYARLRPAGAPDAHGRMVASGDLLDRPDGERIGTFHSNAFCAASPFGGPQAAASNLAFQVLELGDGTLFGIGAGVDLPAGQATAIIGGTSRFAGRSGSCVQRSIAAESGDNLREFIITFA